MDESRSCPNCGGGERARYCGECGQRQGERLVSMRRLLADVVEDQFSLSGRLPLTLWSLVARPGFLTKEYAAGRIARYVAPFRLYLLCSLAFFLTLGWSTEVDRLVSVGPVAQEDVAGAGDDTIGQPAGAVLAGPRPGPEAAAGGVAGVKASGAEQAAPADLRLAFEDSAEVPAWMRPLARRMKRQEERLEAMPPEDAARAWIAGFERNAPKAAFLALPVFALILKVLYLRDRRMYVEHFVFALHVHAFAFLIAAVMLAVPNQTASGILFLWIPVYLFWAMRRVYRQSWLRTAAKYALLTVSYFTVLIFVLVLAVMFTTLVA